MFALISQSSAIYRIISSVTVNQLKQPSNCLHWYSLASPVSYLLNYYYSDEVETTQFCNPCVMRVALSKRTNIKEYTVCCWKCKPWLRWTRVVDTPKAVHNWYQFRMWSPRAATSIVCERLLYFGFKPKLFSSPETMLGRINGTKFPRICGMRHNPCEIEWRIRFRWRI